MTIVIRGSGIDINASIDDPPEFGTGLKTAITSIAEQLAGRAAQTSEPAPPHDFDVVLRVIKHGDLQVVQAIADLVGRELEARRAAS